MQEVLFLSMFTQTSAPFLGGAYRDHLLPERKKNDDDDDNDDDAADDDGDDDDSNQ